MLFFFFMSTKLLLFIFPVLLEVIDTRHCKSLRHAVWMPTHCEMITTLGSFQLTSIFSYTYNTKERKKIRIKQKQFLLMMRMLRIHSFTFPSVIRQSQLQSPWGTRHPYHLTYFTTASLCLWPPSSDSPLARDPPQVTTSLISFSMSFVCFSFKFHM